MAKANSLTVRRNAWQSVINRWVIGMLGALARRRPDLPYYCEGVAMPHSVFLKIFFNAKTNLLSPSTTKAVVARRQGQPSLLCAKFLLSTRIA